MNSLEAGEQAYSERKDIYETLKIEDRKAYFTRGESWMVVTDMTKEDLLNLAHAAIEEEDLKQMYMMKHCFQIRHTGLFISRLMAN